jgi:hydrogenase expression/formation protein HypC
MCLAIPGEVVEIRTDAEMKLARVRFGGITREVCLDFQPDAAVGDFVLVHVGFAIAIVDRDEAARSWAMLEELGELDELAEPDERDLGSDGEGAA